MDALKDIVHASSAGSIDIHVFVAYPFYFLPSVLSCSPSVDVTEATKKALLPPPHYG